MPRPVSTKTTLGKARALIGITSQQLAKRSGVGQSTIQKIENGTFQLTESVAKKLGWAMMVDPKWLLYGKATSKPRSFSGGEWSPEQANNANALLSSPIRWTDAERQSAATSAQQVLNNAGELVNRAMADGKIWQVVLDLDGALREIFREYYPTEFAEKFPKQPLTLKRPQSKQSSRKPSKKA